MAKALGSGDVLEIERDWIDVSTQLPQPDPRWSGTDAQGHEHHYADGGDHYPTLHLEYGERYWCADCGHFEIDSWYVCRLCGEKITPGTFVDTNQRRVPGRVTYLLNGEPISEERAKEILAERATP